MRNLLLLAAYTTALLCFSCDQAGNTKTPAAGPTTTNDSAAMVTRGAYLVTIAGCNDCHSPKKMGPNGPEVVPETQLSGYPSDRPVSSFDSALAQKGIAQFNEDMTAAAGPWGISFASNLTSDDSGAGSWPLENFKNALRHGKFKGMEAARPLLPPMPWFNLAKLTDEDIQAIHAYLKTTAPVKNVAPAPMQFKDMAKQPAR
ncbi:c-type cytochrome [Niabella drilacis]|uniref:Cytochrome c n=1 Tax=Niabella drilacis (strain DSM 25811 / CCM 8410 / CCUG 62505 / LMG 26954 / E90) TaxID=1285928 RepID=A0A1G6Z6X5_NIADE|nr:c-type cytochrome [Niabella drilacis]SDD98281.1 Cytochrome c [Niabella drilacis]